MSRESDGVDKRLEYTAGAIVTTAPLTLFAWFKRTDAPAAADSFIVFAAVAGATNNNFSLGIDATDTLFGRSRTSATSQATAGVVADTTTWHNGIFITASATSRFCGLDGVLGLENTTSRVPAGINACYLMGNASGTISNEFEGLLAHVAIWDIALTQADYDDLQTMTPDQVQPGNLVAYWPLLDNESPEIDDAGAFDLTVNGPTFSADNPVISGGSAESKPNLMLLGVG